MVDSLNVQDALIILTCLECRLITLGFTKYLANYTFRIYHDYESGYFLSCFDYCWTSFY